MLTRAESQILRGAEVAGRRTLAACALALPVSFSVFKCPDGHQQVVAAVTPTKSGWARHQQRKLLVNHVETCILVDHLQLRRRTLLVGHRTQKFSLH